MLSYFFIPKAEKELIKIPKKIQRQIFEDIEKLCCSTHPLENRSVLKLRGPYDLDTYRLRSGNYRIIFRFDGESIKIGSVRHRQKGY